MLKEALPDQTLTGESAALRYALAEADPRTIGPGESLLRQGDDSDFALYLAEGRVGVFTESDYGRVSLAEISAPKLIGEIGVLAGLPRTASIETITPVTVYRLTRLQMMELGRHAPEFLLSVIGQLGRQIDGANRALGLYAHALSALERREFDPRILDDLSNPSPQVMALANSMRRFATQILDKRRREEELAAAAVIQRSFLPRPEILRPANARLDLHDEMRPAREVGGDFYDFFMLDEHRVAVAVGDVCGKGIPASLFMTVVINTLRSAARDESDVAATLARTNAILCRDNEASMFATLFYGVLDLEKHVLDYGNCGHNAPLIISPAGIRTLATTGVPVGLIPNRQAATHQISLSPDEVMLLFTDGVSEAMNKQQEEFGNERLEAAMAEVYSLAPAEIIPQLFAHVDTFANGEDQADDLTGLAFRIRPTAA